MNWSNFSMKWTQFRSLDRYQIFVSFSFNFLEVSLLQLTWTICRRFFAPVRFTVYYYGSLLFNFSCFFSFFHRFCFSPSIMAIECLTWYLYFFICDSIWGINALENIHLTEFFVRLFFFSVFSIWFDLITNKLSELVVFSLGEQNHIWN